MLGFSVFYNTLKHSKESEWVNPMERFILAPILTLLLSTSSLCAVPLYQVIDLGTLGGTQSAAYGLNNSGYASGYSNLNGITGTHAFYWHNNSMIDANPSGYSGSCAYGINDEGYVVGMAYKSQQQYVFIWKDGNATIVGSGYACAINNNNEIVGYSGILGTGQHRAFQYRNGVLADLGSGNTAWGENDLGQVVGDSTSSVLRAVMWQNGTMTYLGDLGGVSSSAASINDYGEAVGYSSNAQGEYHAVLWRDGTTIDLGMLAGHHTYAKAINNSNQIVGFASSYGAFLWQDGVMTDINTLISSDSAWNIGQAWDINDSGQIIGCGDANGAIHAVLLNPVPEPSSILALLLGIWGIGGIAWRRRK